MSLMDRLECALILTPIIALFGLGLVLTLRSGVANLSTGQGAWQVVENLYKTVLMIGASLICLALLQQCLGMRVAFFW